MQSLAVGGDIVLLAISESLPPHILFAELEWLRADAAQVQSLALIDTRTCDCFPHVRHELELHSDVIVMMPYSLDAVQDEIADAIFT